MNKTEWLDYQKEKGMWIGTWCPNHKPKDGQIGNVRFVELKREDDHMICPECKTIYPYRINENKTS